MAGLVPLSSPFFVEVVEVYAMHMVHLVPQRCCHLSALCARVRDIHQRATVGGTLLLLLQPLPIILGVAGHRRYPLGPHGGWNLLSDSSTAAPGVHRSLGVEQVGDWER
jgi:hypothetical protein